MNTNSKELTEMRYDQVIDLTAERFNRNAPKHIRFENEKGFAIQILQNNAYLMKVASENPASLQQAVTNIAAIGLSLNPAKKQAYLISRTVKTADGKFVSKIFLEPSYVGLCDLCTMSGTIDWLQSAVVYTGDEFIDNGPGEKPTHRYQAFSKERGEFAGVYCTAKTSKGDYLTTIMPASDVIAIRERSEAVKSFRNKNVGNGGPWLTDFEEMAKKSVVRRAYKMLPKTAESERMDNAVMLSNENEGFEALVSSPPLGQFTADQKGFFDGLITNGDGVGMFLFRTSIDEPIFTNLYHSFTKGDKGKYQKIVDALLQKGQGTLLDCVAALQGFAEQDDIHGATELLADLSGDAVEYMKGQCDPQTVSFIIKCETANP
jgi:recombination protein RecT